MFLNVQCGDLTAQVGLKRTGGTLGDILNSCLSTVALVLFCEGVLVEEYNVIQLFLDIF